MNKQLLYILTTLILVTACSEKAKTFDSSEIKTQDVLIHDFENDNHRPSISNATITFVQKEGIISGKQALKINFLTDDIDSSVSFKAEQPMDWSQLGNINLAVDISNPSAISTQISLQITDINGTFHRRSVSIPANSSGTYYAILSGPQLAFDSGLREDPKSWQSNDFKMFWMNGSKNINLAKVSEINFTTQSLKHEKTLIIDNIRIRQNPEFNTEYLTELADEFGQSYKFDYPTKIKSEVQLKTLATKEIAQLEAEGTMAERSKFGGWSKGPQLKATGYFRTEKVNGKWAIVDPEGYLFFSSALANIRIANTTTFTGVDFKDDSVRYKDPEDVTPEDSLGIRPVSKEAQKTHFISSKTRNDMFTWLPDYDHELANHYSYRRESHQGPLQHGETFSFYQANLERRYGETYPDSYLDKWRDVTIKRFKNWGFTSTGNWTDVSFYQMNEIPYFANGWIIGDFKTVSSGHDVWRRMPDPFDPEFIRRAKITTQVIAEEVKNNPWCIGVFIDNEQSWGNPKSLESRFGIAINTLGLNDDDSPTKEKFTQIIKTKYQDIAQLNNAWGLTIDSWGSFINGVDIKQLPIEGALLTDLADLSYAYADQYFKVVHNALAEVLPNHMYMGARMAAWGVSPDAAKAATKYADIMSYNYYREYLHTKQWEFLAELDKPSIIGEFHIGATSDTGLYHPGLIHGSNQQDRARMYKDYMHSVIDNPYMVGSHWFQYTDSPLTGRAYDGENYNVGFVSTTDTPYQEMVKAAKEVNGNLYQRRFGYDASQ